MIINVNNTPLQPVCIGRRGEHDFREIAIDVSTWLAVWPEGKISVIYRRPDGELYPVIVNATESPIMWRPTAADTAVAGIGQLEARIQIGDVLGKSCTIPGKVLPALGTPGNAPAAPSPDWTQTVAEDAAKAEAAAGRAEAVAVSTPYIGDNGNWYVWDADSGKYTDSGVPAGGGGGGNDGFSPTANVTPTDGGTVIEITDKNGTTSATIYNGKDGSDGSPGAPGANGKDGADGKSAYQIWLAAGNTGAEADFLAALKATPAPLARLEQMEQTVIRRSAARITGQRWTSSRSWATS